MDSLTAMTALSQRLPARAKENSSVVRGNRELRVVKAPRELHPFHFLMAWHPRLNTDPRHVWLREATRSDATRSTSRCKT
jgi:hypothetical protein